MRKQKSKVLSRESMVIEIFFSFRKEDFCKTVYFTGIGTCGFSSSSLLPPQAAMHRSRIKAVRERSGVLIVL
jgi:hypothetical protein